MSVALHDTISVVAKSDNGAQHVGRFIRQRVIPAGMSVTEAARRLGVGRPALSNLVNGRAALSQNMALRLEATFGADRARLLELQAAGRSGAPERRGPGRGRGDLCAELPHDRGAADRGVGGADRGPRPSAGAAAPAGPRDGTRAASRGLPRLRQRPTPRLGRPGRSGCGDALGAGRPVVLGVRGRPAPQGEGRQGLSSPPRGAAARRAGEVHFRVRDAAQLDGQRGMGARPAGGWGLEGGEGAGRQRSRAVAGEHDRPADLARWRAGGSQGFSRRSTTSGTAGPRPASRR